MRKLIHELHTTLDKMKSFDAGYTSRVDNKMVLDYEDRRYIITIREIENPSKDMMEDIDKFL